MARETSLAGAWTLTGRETWEDGGTIGPVLCRVPGAVCDALEEAGYLLAVADPAARLAREWVSRRQWTFACSFTPPQEPYEGRSEKFFLNLRVAGRGVVEVDGRQVGVFNGPWQRHAYDITRHAEAGVCQISVCIREPMDGEGGEPSAAILEASVKQVAFARILHAKGVGSRNGIQSEVCLEGYSSGRVRCRYRVLLGEELAASLDVEEKLIADRQTYQHAIPVPDMKPWRTNASDRAVYTVRLTIERGGSRCDVMEWACAWKDIEFIPAPGGWSALPYALREGGLPVFLRGVNATARATPHELEGIAAAGGNLVRFQGALPPGEELYALCDRLGLLIWQEVPSDEASAVDTARRLAAHPAAAIASCFAGLCGPDGSPAAPSHPDAALVRSAMQPYCEDLNFLPSSPSGPIAYPVAKDYGRGLCHDVHGPLEISLELYAQMDQSDALLLSKVGFPAPQRLGSGTLWRESFGDYYDAMAYLCGPFQENQQGEFLALGRHLQAEALKYAVFAARRREGISCCGAIAWRLGAPSGFPVSHALADDGGLERPALAALSLAWKGVAASAMLDKAYFLRGETLDAPIYLHVPAGDMALYAVRAQVCDLRGAPLAEELWQVRPQGQATLSGAVSLPLGPQTPEVLLLRLWVHRGEEEVFCDVYVLAVPQEGQARFSPLRNLPDYRPQVSAAEEEALVHNDFTQASCGVTIHAGRRLIFSGTLMPWEKRPLPLPQGVMPESLRVQTMRSNH